MIPANPRTILGYTFWLRLGQSRSSSLKKKVFHKQAIFLHNLLHFLIKKSLHLLIYKLVSRPQD